MRAVDGRSFTCGREAPISRMKAGYPVLYGFLGFSILAVAFHLWLLLGAGGAERNAAYSVFTPFLSMPYLFSVGLLVIFLAKPMEQVRRALSGVLVVVMVSEVVWWLTLAPQASHAAAVATTVGRALWILALPLMWLRVLHIPSISKLIETDGKGHVAND